jgi:5-(carboxyamino)imidazole ribonucleotide synthase
LHICQHRLREKKFLSDAGLPLPRFIEVSDEKQLAAGVKELGTPCVIKTASFGYDGKGQQKIDDDTDLKAAWAPFIGAQAVLEEWVPFEQEISVIIARSLEGQMVTYPVCENRHANHILDFTMVPAEVSSDVAYSARQLAGAVAENLELVGLLAVEMFLLPDDSILINELAPRPHNSGTFQFRRLCHEPVRTTASRRLRPAAGKRGTPAALCHGEPAWRSLGRRSRGGTIGTGLARGCRVPDVKIHLYGKDEPRRGRKMGHLVAFGGTLAVAAGKSAGGQVGADGSLMETLIERTSTPGQLARALDHAVTALNGAKSSPCRPKRFTAWLQMRPARKQ